MPNFHWACILGNISSKKDSEDGGESGSVLDSS